MFAINTIKSETSHTTSDVLSIQWTYLPLILHLEMLKGRAGSQAPRKPAPTSLRAPLYMGFGNYPCDVPPLQALT